MLILAAVLSLLPPPVAADIILRIPPEARGELPANGYRDAALTPDSLLSDGRRYDCWVFGVEPGDDVTIAVNTPAFSPAVVILPEPVCNGRAALYMDQAAARSPLHAAVTFNAERNTFGVLVTSRRPGDTGVYRITFTAEPPDQAPAWRTYTPSEPERLIAALYAPDSDSDLGDPAFVDRTFAPVTAAALKALHAGGAGLGFDILADGQDSDLSAPDIRPRVWLARSSLIDVRFTNMGEPVHLQFHMRETPAGWRIEDIESRDADNDQKWVLSRLLGLDLGVAVARQD
jgi:hypothetical protein